MQDNIGNRLNGKGGQYSKLLTITVGSAGSVWLNTQYHGIDDTPTTEKEYQINNLIEMASFDSV